MNTEQPIKRAPEDWDRFFLGFAKDVAGMSKDPARQVGAVLTSPDRRQMSIGFNGFPPEVPDLPSTLANNHLKQMMMVHAEDNCLRQAPFETAGSTMYVTRFPCCNCASKLRDAGVVRLVAPAPDLTHERWGKSWTVAIAVLTLAGVQIIYEEVDL